jgi:nicotinate dehydrogenase subunit B
MNAPREVKDIETSTNLDAGTISRRDFLKAGGALVLGFSLAPETALTQARPPLPGSLNTNRMLDGWVRIGADGRVTIMTGKIELGQGIGTALSQIAADELDVDIKRIDMVYGDTGRTPNEGQTAGSQSIEQSGTALRFACAEARSLLIGAAAAKLGVEAGSLKVDDGRVLAAGNRSASYWELAGELNLKREASGKVPPKNPSEYKWVGKSIARRDIPNKFTGGAAYVQDIRLTGMLHGRVVRPPSPGAELLSFDEAGAKKLPGVIAVVRDGNFVAVAAEREEQAIRAREVIRQSAKWKETATLPPPGDALFDHMMKLPSRDQLVNEKKSATAGKPSKTLQATYTRPFQAHGSIGPSCAIGQWTDNKLTVWTHSQGVFPLRGDLSRAFGMQEADVRCIHAEGAGCYGHNAADDVAFDAAMLAKSCGGRPVRVQLMRDDEFAWEPFGSAMAMKMSASLDDKGNIVDWQHDLWSHPHNSRPGSPDGVNLLGAWLLAKPAKAPYPNDPPQPNGGSDRNSVPLYDFPNQKITKHYLPEMPVRTSALRTLGGYANVYALESFMDELAAAAGADPVEFRLRHMKDPRARAVIEMLAERANWQPGAKGDGERGRGFSFSKYKNLACYCAIVADVELNRRTGTLKLTRAVSVVDAGLIINPDGIRNQIEGGIIQSASWTLMESVKHDRTRIGTRSWADYPILRFEDIPPVQVHLIDRPNERSLGVGEGAQGPMAAAIANALANATGRRIRALPFTPDRVLASLKT